MPAPHPSADTRKHPQAEGKPPIHNPSGTVRSTAIASHATPRK